MGSAALPVAVPYPDKVTEFPGWDNEVLKKKKKKKKEWGKEKRTEKSTLSTVGRPVVAALHVRVFFLFFCGVFLRFVALNLSVHCRQTHRLIRYCSFLRDIRLE